MVVFFFVFLFPKDGQLEHFYKEHLRGKVGNVKRESERV